MWVREIARGTQALLTDTPQAEWHALWSPRGNNIVIFRPGTLEATRVAADGSGTTEPLLTGVPASYSQDGRYLAFETVDGDLAYLDAGEDPPWTNILGRTLAKESSPQLSPDGSLLAYVSDESGTEEIYLTRFPVGGDKAKVSANGGLRPRWSRDGRELFYVHQNRLFRVAVERPGPQGPLRESLGKPEELFDASTLGIELEVHGFDVTAKGDRFLTVQNTERKGTIVLVQNWLQVVAGAKP